MRKRYLGIDPGINHTGWAILDVDGSSSHYVAGGVIEPEKGALSERLRVIAATLSTLCDTYQPTAAACEKVFVNVNPQSTLILGQARGAAIASVALKGVSVAEFSPSEIKQAVTGSGRAKKADIQRMVALLLKLPEERPSDESDAIACALCAAASEKLQTVRLTGTASRTYATPRASRQGKAGREAWTKLLEKKGA